MKIKYDPNERDYCTRKEIAWLIGPDYLSDWRTTQRRIEYLNSRNNERGQMDYHLRRNSAGVPFDIQVHYRSLSSSWKQYLKYRHKKDQPQKYIRLAYDNTKGN